MYILFFSVLARELNELSRADSVARYLNESSRLTSQLELGRADPSWLVIHLKVFSPLYWGSFFHVKLCVSFSHLCWSSVYVFGAGSRKLRR
jgi:hypothetical protein